MTTDTKPLPERFDCTNGNTPWCQGCYTMTPDEHGDYVQWEDYERIAAAKDAEIERLRVDVEAWKASHSLLTDTCHHFQSRAKLLEAEAEAVWAAMPRDSRYLDPPDGGCVPLHEQVRRMAADAAQQPAAVDDAMVERIAALLHEEATDEPWVVAGIEHDGPDRDYYRTMARKVLALAQQPAACPKCGGTGEADSGGIHPWGAPATIPCDCQQPAAEERKGNTPIAELIADYESNGCDHSDMAWVRRAALHYVGTMQDSQVRCLLYTLASSPDEAAAKPSYGAKRNEP